MKQRIKKLLTTGLVFTGATIGVLLLISIIRGIPLTSTKVSDALFSEFLILLALASFLAIKEEFLFKINKGKKREDKKKFKEEKDFNSGIELIIIGLPLVIVSVLITLI